MAVILPLRAQKHFFELILRLNIKIALRQLFGNYLRNVCVSAGCVILHQSCTHPCWKNRNFTNTYPEIIANITTQKLHITNRLGNIYVMAADAMAPPSTLPRTENIHAVELLSGASTEKVRHVPCYPGKSRDFWWDIAGFLADIWGVPANLCLSFMSPSCVSGSRILLLSGVLVPSTYVSHFPRPLSHPMSLVARTWGDAMLPLQITGECSERVQTNRQEGQTEA